MANEGLRVGILGRDVDAPVDDTNPNWTTGGPQGGRNALLTGERVITRAINYLDGELGNTGTVVRGFQDRMNEIVGEAPGPDQATFDGIGKNLIQAVAELMAGGGQGEGLRRGELGDYVRGTHFDGGGLPTLQEFLDEHINGRWFQARATGPTSLTIDNGNVARSTPIVIRNLLMQGLTLYIKSDAQFADTLTISAVTGAIDIDGNWGGPADSGMPPSPPAFATTVNIMNVAGSISINGQSPVNPFQDLNFFNCQDVRITPPEQVRIQPSPPIFEPGQTRIRGVLSLSQSACILYGRNRAYHNYDRTDIHPGSRLEISADLALDRVNLGPDGERSGQILDYRLPNRPEETFRRRTDPGGGTGGPAEWGQITGTLSDQTDLDDELNDVRARISDLETGTPGGGPIDGNERTIQIWRSASSSPHIPRLEQGEFFATTASSGFVPLISQLYMGLSGSATTAFHTRGVWHGGRNASLTPDGLGSAIDAEWTNRIYMRRSASTAITASAIPWLQQGELYIFNYNTLWVGTPGGNYQIAGVGAPSLVGASGPIRLRHFASVTPVPLLLGNELAWVNEDWLYYGKESGPSVTVRPFILDSSSDTVMGRNAIHHGNYNVVYGPDNRVGSTFRTVARNTVLGAHNRIEPASVGAAEDNLVIGRSNWLTGSATFTNNLILGSSVSIRGLSNTLLGSVQGTQQGFASLNEVVGIGRQLGYASLTPSSISASSAISIGNYVRLQNNTAWIGTGSIQQIYYGAGTSTMFSTQSDPRIKDDISNADIERCLADINRLPLKRFSYKPFVGSERDRTVTGFDSRDFAAVFPKAVFSHGYMAGDDWFDDCQSIDQSQLIPTLVGAVQALAAQVRALRH